MATKTISIDLEAYQRLSSARLEARESFSKVIKRATWQQQGKTCEAILSALPGLPVADDRVLDRLEAAQLADSPPDDPRA
jgi:predicted CopG family antitoxin